MKSQHDYNYSSAEAAFVTANTPLFLLRKLRSDPVVRAMALDLSEDEIISALRSAVGQKPTDIREAVLPYLYLVALSIKGKVAPLKQAVDIVAPHAEWFKYIGNYLLQSFTPSTTQVVSILMPKVVLPQPPTPSSSTTTVKKIKYPKGDNSNAL
jgi:hypothetical protein